MMLPKPWHPSDVIKRLTENGLKPINNDAGHLVGFTASKGSLVGLKLWSYLGFLKVGVKWT